MLTSNQAYRYARRIGGTVAGSLFPTRWKEFNEYRYWKGRKQAEGQLTNDHYKQFYTTHFGLDDSFYEGKVILDIGCGPRGSLEWASMASRRMGLDPLAKEYLRLGASEHQMEYIDSPSEQIPLPDAQCDAVFAFNSLDHVESVDQTLSEIKRVTRPGGIFLLIVEINHPPTACEPHDLSFRQLLDSLAPEFSCDSVDVYQCVDGGAYGSILAGEKLPNPEETSEPGWLKARFSRASSS